MMLPVQLKRTILRLIPHRLHHRARMLWSVYVLPRSFRDRLRRYVMIEGKEHPDDIESYCARLRMYCHILDKGLHGSDWKKGHSIDVYHTAKSLFEKCGESDGDTMAWARKIIAEYERRQSAEPPPPPLEQPKNVPPLSPTRLLDQMRYRVSCRQYEVRGISQDLVEKVVEAALEAPWSCSRQALRVYASVNPDTATSALRCFRGFSQFSEYVPGILVFCVDLRPYSMPGELFVPHLDVGLASGHAALMASSLGLSVTFLSWGSRTAEDERRLRVMFDIPPHYEVVVGGTFGYPERMPIRPARKSVSSTIFLR